MFERLREREGSCRATWCFVSGVEYRSSYSYVRSEVRNGLVGSRFRTQLGHGCPLLVYVVSCEAAASNNRTNRLHGVKWNSPSR
jgi:hypothetical protein